MSALHIDGTNELLAERCHDWGVRCAVHVHDLREIDQLQMTEVAYLILPKVDGAKALIRELNALNPETGGKP